MIESLVTQWEARKEVLREAIAKGHPESYESLVRMLVDCVLTAPVRPGRERINPECIHVIDDGDYQGTLIFVLALETYQPDEDDYLWFSNYYGSCSGCDALAGIREYTDDPPTPEQVGEYMDLALHMVQRIRWLVPKDSP